MNKTGKNVAVYPFYVSERDDEGRCLRAECKTQMHGFSIISADCMETRFFAPACAGGTENGSNVYEIRVRNNAGEWQDWQAIVGDFDIVSAVHTDGISETENSVDIFKNISTRFKDNFEVRYCGLLWRVELGSTNDVQIVNDEDDFIKTVNLNTFKVGYSEDAGNTCVTDEDRLSMQRAFRNKYHSYEVIYERV